MPFVDRFTDIDPLRDRVGAILRLAKYQNQSSSISGISKVVTDKVTLRYEASNVSPIRGVFLPLSKYSKLV